MTLAELDTQLHVIAGELRVINDQTPEMTGIDLAFERGNITHEEWQAASNAATASVKRAEEQVQRIDLLRQEQPELMAEYMTQLLDRLASLRVDAEARLAEVQERTLRFNAALLPDLIACLTAWRDRTPNKSWPPWAWRIVFRIADETAAALENVTPAT